MLAHDAEHDEVDQEPDEGGAQHDRRNRASAWGHVAGRQMREEYKQ